ncbi:hypothetical protein EV13_2466 [Prochlorococcus sp. MIT 0702]|nr:hypothetical protein EV12_2249 [Prochlorococcus sp. MIT 0701]KGG26334.1 hypothetical protein EV13_2466 [Prochlorococcus sp. MIT 0702]KGG31249.1 hypothetical protein EV14_2621 [Prochlorococcus sp. MIT 0703]
MSNCDHGNSLSTEESHPRRSATCFSESFPKTPKTPKTPKSPKSKTVLADQFNP